MKSQAIFRKQVYTQDTAPGDTRAGVLWVDTSVSPPNTKTYDETTGTWEPVATENLAVQDTAPTDPTNGMLWVDTSVTPPNAQTYDGTDSAWNDVGVTDHNHLSGVTEGQHRGTDRVADIAQAYNWVYH